MTIKYSDCPICGNLGRFMKMTVKSDQFGDKKMGGGSSPQINQWASQTRSYASPHFFNSYLGEGLYSEYEIEDSLCDCVYGREMAIIEDRMNYPEYENSTTKMTSEEILAILNNASDNLRALDQEFNV